MEDTMGDTLHQKPKKPMTKEEVTLLLDLVASKKVIVSKETNAPTNKLKEEAWNYVTTVFNAKSRRPRHKEQLKLKWDNLKKSARKRSQKMKKMASTDEEYNCADQILDRVIEIFQMSNSSNTTDVPNEALTLNEGEICPDAYCDTSTYMSKAKKRKLLSDTDDDGRLERNAAIANYYRKKAEKMNLEIELLKIELAQRKNHMNDFSGHT